MNDLPNRDEGVLDGAAVNAEHHDCMGCGYNLEHTHSDAMCPECGKPVAESATTRPISRADPEWARGMAKALRWSGFFYIGIVGYWLLVMGGSVALIVVMMVKTIAANQGHGPQMTATASGDLSFMKWGVSSLLILNYFVMVGSLLVLEGLTRVEPGVDVAQWPLERWRRGARFSLPLVALVMTVGLPLQIYSIMHQDFNAKTPPPLNPWMLFVVVAAIGISVLLFYVFCAIPLEVSHRLGVRKLRRQARRVMVYSIVAGCGWILATPVALTTPYIADLKWKMALNCLACPFMGVMFVAIVLLVAEGMINSFGLARCVEERVKAGPRVLQSQTKGA